MYNQDTGQEFQDINSTVTLLVEALKVQDKDLVKICEQTLINLVGNEEATLILNAVISQLAGASPEYYLRTQCTVSQETKCMFAVQKLIHNGFILGKNFSTNANDTILVRRDIKVSLMLLCSRSQWKFIKSVVQIAE